MIIAIDGPAGSGKTTTAREVAKRLGCIHVNSGAMYRAITLKFLREKVNLDDSLAIIRTLQDTQLNFVGPQYGSLYMDDEDISEEILSTIVTENVSRISAIPEVRMKLVEYQRKMVQGINAVLEGRDIATVVFPDADFKFFLVADIEVRAQRRMKEIESTGDCCTIEEIIHLLKERDHKDSSREFAPLIKAKDAIELDTTALSIKEQVNFIINIVT